MFDKTYIKQASPYPQNIIHVENRAPTDESVKLLKEFEEKAEKKIMQAVRLEGNTLKAVYHVIDNPMLLETKVIIQFEINGLDHKIEFGMPYDDTRTAQTLGHIISKHIQEKLAEIFTKEILFNKFKVWEKITKR